MAGVLCPQQAEGLRAETPPLFALNLGVASEVLCACALRFFSQPLVQHLVTPRIVSAKDNAEVRGPTCDSHFRSLLLNFGFS